MPRWRGSPCTRVRRWRPRTGRVWNGSAVTGSGPRSRKSGSPSPMRDRSSTRYPVRGPTRRGSPRLVMEPTELLRRLAALCPSPRTHLIRYPCVMQAPSSTTWHCGRYSSSTISTSHVGVDVVASENATLAIRTFTPRPAVFAQASRSADCARMRVARPAMAPVSRAVRTPHTPPRSFAARRPSEPAVHPG